MRTYKITFYYDNKPSKTYLISAANSIIAKHMATIMPEAKKCLHMSVGVYEE